MKEMWNKRYAQEAYVYGKEPNDFFKQELLKLTPGKILLPAEGEGRNAVFAAKQGWDVYAFDNSSEALKKAERLTKEHKVTLLYRQTSFDEITYPADFFDVIGLFYAHTLSRSTYHQKLIPFLKPGGLIILEGFSKKQIQNKTGGPRNVEMLFSREELLSDFNTLSLVTVEEKEVELNEGEHHKGAASVIRLIAKK